MTKTDKIIRDHLTLRGDGMRSELAVLLPDGAERSVAFGMDRALAERVRDLLAEVIAGFAGMASTGAAAAKPAKFPKLDYVSFYPVKSGRSGRVTFRVSYRIRGYRRRTDRLGPDGTKAYKWACTVNEVLAAVKARLVSPADAFKRLCIDRRPLKELFDAYERQLKTKGVNEDYRQSTIYRLKETAKLGGMTRWDHVSRAAVESSLEKLVERDTRVDPETGKGASGQKLAKQTVNYYLKALKQFTRWMAKSGRVSDDPLQFVSGVKGGDEDRRRDASLEDVKALYAAAMSDKRKDTRVMKGPDRAMLYLYAFCTGLREDELRSIDVTWLRLDGDRPALIVGGEITKNEQRAVQPLPAWLASATVDWLGERKSGPMFAGMPLDMCRPFARDRKSAGLAHKSHDGKLVFHSLRHGYASALLDSDAETKLVQSLVRHSTITLLFDRYGHARKGKAHAAVEKALPNLLPAPPAVGAQA